MDKENNIMNIDWNRWTAWMVTVTIVIALIVLTSSIIGCKSWQSTSGGIEMPDIPDTPVIRFKKAVKSIGWLIMLSVIGMSVSAFALLNGNKWALSSLVGSGIMMGLSLVISRYAELLAFITLLCLFGGIGFFIYSVIVKKKAISELVRSIEKIKPALNTQQLTAIFKDEKSLVSVPSIQSSTTKKLVAVIRDKMLKDVK